jgi:hypothetical protein
MNTRPNICFVVNTLNQYLVEPRCVHLVVEKHVMRYHKGTLDYGLFCTRDHCCASFITLVRKIEVLPNSVGFVEQDNCKEKS